MPLASPEAVVVSLPPGELAEAAIPGSVFDLAALDRAPVSPEVRTALDVIAGKYAGAAPIKCVARPEMFTHGASLGWLQQTLGAATDHINLSDGSSVKLIPFLRNHLFTFGLQSQRRSVEFKKLMRRAPELLGQFDSQINTFHRFAHEGLAVEPASVVIMPTQARVPATPWYYGFYLNPHSAEDSAERMLGWGELTAPTLDDFREVTYVPLTECATKDSSFQKMVAELIAAAYFEPKAGFILRLPPGSSLGERVRVAVDGIRMTGLRLPQTRSANIFFVGDDLAEETLTEIGGRLALVLHQTFDYWRYTRPVYAAAQKITFCLDSDWRRPTEGARKVTREAFGQAPRFVVSVRRPEGEWAAE